MNLIRAAVVLLAASALPLAAQQAAPVPADVAPIARRLAATAQLAAQEYRIGVPTGTVVASAEEVEEARLFLTEAKRSAALLPPAVARDATARLDAVLAMVGRVAQADSVEAAVRQLSDGLAGTLGITMDEIPAAVPSLARGAQVYQAQCASCHGAVGRGDGAKAAGLTPPPADLTDAGALVTRSPLDFYRKISIGVAGTAMPAFEGQLSVEDRWAAAVYASVLRLPAAAGEVPPALTAFATTAAMSDRDLGDALGPAASPRELAARIAAVRSYQTAAPTEDKAGPVFAAVSRQLDSSLTLAEAGQAEAAGAAAFDAYMTFEQVEPGVRAKNAGLATDLETAFAALRTRAAGGAPVTELRRIRERLAGQLELAERTLGGTMSPFNLFVQSLVIMLREGLEAILVIGALMTFLVRTGAGHRKRDIHVGVGAAIVMSLLTALALETVIQITPASREALEGVTMVVATVVLFYVSYWLLSKMEVAKWTDFVKSRVQDAVTSGSALALASAAFLAVYREGFETVLFYKALFVAGGTGATALPVLGGIAVGTLLLAGVYVAINRFGVRLPLRPFFAFTSAFLYYMAFVFAGKGVAELQEGGLVGTTVVAWAPRLPALGIYPTVESLLAQAVLVVLALVALAWTFVIAPRRQAAAPAPAAPAAPPPPAREAVQPRPSSDLIRSLERMDADLAALRAEVERMRDLVAKQQAPAKH